MDEGTNKAKIKINKCKYRRISIEHEIDENIRKKTHLSNLHFYNYREQLFNQKVDRLRKNLEHIEPYSARDDTATDGDSLMTPNCFSRIHNHFRLLNFSPDSEKRLSCQAPSYGKTSKQTSNQLPIIQQKSISNEIDQCQRRVSFYQSRLPMNYSCRSGANNHFSNADEIQEKTLRSYINQHLTDEQGQQMKNNERKSSLLKEFDQLKHTIDDPNSTFSVLAALSRALLFFDSARK